MKKISLLILCGIMLLSICGCGSKDLKSDTNNGNSDSDNETSTGFNVDEFKELKTLNGNINEEVILTGKNFLVTKNNTVFEFNLEKLYSNDTNYKDMKLNYEIIGAGEYLLHTNNDNKYYSFMDDDWFTDRYNVINSMFNDYKYRFIYYINGARYFIAITQDNEIHFNDRFKIDNNPLLNIDTLKDENIIALYCGQTSNTIIIKTDKAYYNLSYENTIINKEQCEKYADIECEYEPKLIIEKNELATKYYSDIKFISENYYIFNDGKVYTEN